MASPESGVGKRVHPFPYVPKSNQNSMLCLDLSFVFLSSVCFIGSVVFHLLIVLLIQVGSLVHQDLAMWLGKRGLKGGR